MKKKNRLPSGYLKGQYGRVHSTCISGASDLFSIMLIDKSSKFQKIWKPVYYDKNNNEYIKYGGKKLKVIRPKSKGFRWDTPFDFVAYKK